MSDFVFSRSYRGKVKAVILDWSGTTADAYVLAPAVVFVEVFKKQDVEITMAEARGPMGLRKDLHIKALTEDPEIRARWAGVHGKEPDQGDVDRMFADFVPMQLSCLREYTDLLPGVADVVKRMQDRGIKIGSTTGFTRPMVDILELFVGGGAVIEILLFGRFGTGRSGGPLWMTVGGYRKSPGSTGKN